MPEGVCSDAVWREVCIPWLAAPLLCGGVPQCWQGWTGGHGWQILPAQTGHQSLPVRVAELISTCIFLTGPFSGCLGGWGSCVNCLRLIALAVAKQGSYLPFPPWQPFPMGVFLLWPCILLGLDVWARDWLSSSLQIAKSSKPLQEHSWNCLEGLFVGHTRCGGAFTQNGLLRPIQLWSWCVLCSLGGVSQMSLCKKSNLITVALRQVINWASH